MLYHGAQALAREADTMTRRNFEEEAAKLVEALAARPHPADGLLARSPAAVRQPHPRDDHHAAAACAAVKRSPSTT